MNDIERALREIHRDARSLEMSDEDLRRVVDRYRTPTPRRRRRARWLLALVPVAIIAAGASWVATRPSTEAQVTTGIACAQTTGDRPNLSIIGADGRDPADICAELWSRGDVDPTTHTVPALTACGASGPYGSVVVYPTADRDVCEKLGRPPLPADYLEVAAKLAGLQRVANSPACRTLEEAQAAVGAELARVGADDWTTSIQRVPDAAPCAQVTIDGERRLVTISEVTPVPEPSPTVAARDRAWLSIVASIRRANPGWPQRGCPEPAATLNLVRHGAAGTVLAQTPVLVDSGSGVPGIAFNRVLHCADVALSVGAGERAEAILLIPEVPRGSVSPTNEDLQRLTLEANQTLGLPTRAIP